MADVLLTYCWVRSTYAALRNLAGHGLDVVVADSNRVGMCQLSNRKRRFRRYMSPFIDENAFISDIQKIILLDKPIVLIPSHDETEILARHRGCLEPDVCLPVPEVHQLEEANDKARSIRIAKECGIPVPDVLKWTDLGELRREIKKIGMPVVVKLRKGNSAKGVFYPKNNDAVVDAVDKLIGRYNLTRERYPIVQERISGEGWGVSALYWKGEPITSFVHRRLREKTATGGTSTLREAGYNQMMESMAHRLLQKMNWHGLAMVEFKYDPEKDQIWFIEINPRLWGSIHLAISAGVEFPYLLYLCATKGPHAAKEYQAAQSLKYPWRARWYLGDLICAVEAMKNGNLRKAVRLSLPGGADVFDDWSWSDPFAFIGEVIYYGQGFLKTGSINPVEQGMLG